MASKIIIQVQTIVEPVGFLHLPVYCFSCVLIIHLVFIYWDTGFVDVVRDDPTNNVPDIIFSRLGMQLHRRAQHPLGILKNAIFEYFDTSYSNKFDKFDDLCPIVSVKQVSMRIRIIIHSKLHVYNVFLCLTSVAHMQLEILVAFATIYHNYGLYSLYATCVLNKDEITFRKLLVSKRSGPSLSK